MRRTLLLLLICFPFRLAAQSATAAQAPLPPDERFKVDILVVVAHPDDEAAVTPYLARAIYDQQKRVAVVFGTRGGSGANDASAETGPSLAAIREIEAHRACAALGITNVWFLGGKDTASQNVLQSLSNWGHGAALEEMVRLVRLTRPEVMLAWLPGVFIGENHGDHQAAGVLATEAFDLAGDPAVFPEQIAGAARRLEPLLGNLQPWQPKKIYYFSDAANDRRFQGTGPAYSVKEVSPARKLPYWRMAVEAAKPHRTQFPADIDRLEQMTEAQLAKMADSPDFWWSEPLNLIFGKSVVGGSKTGDVFERVERGAIAFIPPQKSAQQAVRRSALLLAGPWGFYGEFRRAHGLESLPQPSAPEIAVEAGSTVYVPLQFENSSFDQREVTLEVVAPAGWKILSGSGAWRFAPSKTANLRVEIETPALAGGGEKNPPPGEVTVRAVSAGRLIGEVHLRVALRPHALPQ